MNVDSDIRNRTFGIEIEMCNLERAKVTLPEGYSWSKEESIDNTDCSSNKQFGGEVNTPPLHLCCLKELHDLRSVYESMVAGDAGDGSGSAKSIASGETTGAITNLGAGGAKKRKLVNFKKL